jgi:2-polyprenyl-6-methoxyphenol hydroxylase-like FAD-dependent oxidoreductase
MAIEALGAPKIRGTDFSTAGVLVHYDYPEIEHGYRMSVRRGLLDDALARFAASLPTVEMRQGCTVTELLWEGDRVVGVRFAEGGVEHEERSRLVVGADGRMSWLARRVAAPVYEEMLFRGHIQTIAGRLFHRWGLGVNGGGAARWAAVVAASLMFALVHETWMAPMIFVLSLGLGYVYERTGNLWASILVHAIFNTISTVAFLNFH